MKKSKTTRYQRILKQVTAGFRKMTASDDCAQTKRFKAWSVKPEPGCIGLFRSGRGLIQVFYTDSSTEAGEPRIVRKPDPARVYDYQLLIRVHSDPDAGMGDMHGDVIVTGSRMGLAAVHLRRAIRKSLRERLKDAPADPKMWWDATDRDLTALADHVVATNEWRLVPPKKDPALKGFKPSKDFDYFMESFFEVEEKKNWSVKQDQPGFSKRKGCREDNRLRKASRRFVEAAVDLTLAHEEHLKRQQKIYNRGIAEFNVWKKARLKAAKKAKPS